MNTDCQPLPKSVAEGMLQTATRALCDRPADSAEQRDSLTRQLIYSTLGFEPRDGLEYMIASLVFGHYHAILDSMRDVFQGQMDSVKAKTKSGIVGLDRMMLSYVREMRMVRRRPLALWAKDAQRQTEAATASAPARPAAVTPEPPPARSAADPIPQAAPVVKPTAPPAAATPNATAPSPELAKPATVPAATTTPATGPANPASVFAATTTPAATPPPTPARPADVFAATTTSPDRGATPPEIRLADLALAVATANGTDPSGEAPWTEEDEANFEQHIAEFQEAVAAMNASIEEVRASGPGQIVRAESGD